MRTSERCPRLRIVSLLHPQHLAGRVPCGSSAQRDNCSRSFLLACGCALRSGALVCGFFRCCTLSILLGACRAVLQRSVIIAPAASSSRVDALFGAVFCRLTFIGGPPPGTVEKRHLTGRASRLHAVFCRLTLIGGPPPGTVEKRHLTGRASRLHAVP